MRYWLTILAVLAGVSFQAFAQVTLTERARTVLNAGEGLVNQQILDLNEDGNDDLVLSLYNTASHHFRILALGTDGSQLWTVVGNTGPTETVWNGSVAKSPLGLRLFTIEGSPDSTAATLTVRAYDLTTMTVLDSTVNYYPWTQPPVPNCCGNRNRLLSAALTALPQNDSVIVYAGFAPEVLLYGGWDDHSELISALFAGSSFQNVRMADGPYAIGVPSSPVGILSTGHTFHNTQPSNMSSSESWAIYRLSSIDAVPVLLFGSTYSDRAGKQFDGAQVMGEYFQGLSANSTFGPMLVTRARSYPSDFYDNLIALTPDLSGRRWSLLLQHVNLSQPVNLPAIGHFVQIAARDSVGASTAVCLYYPSGTLEVRAVADGHLLSSQALGLNVIASVASSSGEQYVLSRDTDLVRLFSVESAIDTFVGNDPTVDDGQTVPTELFLQQNFPNPFNPTTTIRYSVPGAMHVLLELYNSLGQEVRTLVDENVSKGWHEVTVNGSRLASGCYFYRLQAGGRSTTKSLVLVH